MRRLGCGLLRPLDPETGQIHPRTDPSLLGDAAWVRLPVRPEPWGNLGHPEAQAAYRFLLDRYRQAGFRICLSCGPELVAEPLGDRLRTPAPADAAEAWVGAYLTALRTLLEAFGDRIDRIEVLPDPNREAAPREPRIHPFWFARLLAGAYRLLKVELGLKRIVLTAGPLRAHDRGGVQDPHTVGWGYLEETFRLGQAHHGWEDLRERTGAYPVESLGILLLLHQDPASSDETLPDALRIYLDFLYAVWQHGQGWRRIGDLHLVLGWSSTLLGEEGQARRLEAAWPVLANDPRVGPVFWVALQDPAAGEWAGYGLLRSGGLTAEARKPAYGTFQDLARREREADQAPPPEPAFPIADGFQFPVGRPGREVFQDFYVATDFLDPAYHKQVFCRGKGVWHPGEDWNGRGGGDTDLGEPVYAVAHGRVVASGFYRPAWGNVVLIEHRLPDGRRVWSQYAHLRERQVEEGEVVARGQQIGTIGKGEGNRFWAHLHFEIRKKELPPDNWCQYQVPVTDREAVIAHYEKPTAFIQALRADRFRYGARPILHEVIVDSEGTDPAQGRFRKARSDLWFRAPVGYRGRTLYTATSPQVLQVWAEWRPRLPADGLYEVFAFVPREHATTRSARYLVVHDGGRTEVVVDQSAHYDAWVSLGTFPFRAGTRGYVRLTDVTGEEEAREIAFDAIRWVMYAL